MDGTEGRAQHVGTRPPASRRLRSRRWLLLVPVVVAAVAAHAGGATDVLTDRRRGEELLTETGALGPLLFVVAFALSHPVGLPSIALTFLAGIVWSAPVAIALAWAGGMAGTLLGFSFARWVARDWVVTRIPPRLRRLDRRLERSPILTVAAVRVLTYLPPPADWVFGVSRIRLTSFVAGTALGILPPTVFIVVAGDRATAWVSRAGWPALVLALVLAGAITVAILVTRRARARAVIERVLARGGDAT